MKRIIKIAGKVLLVLVAALAIFAWVLHQPLPKGQSGKAADAMARKMLSSLNPQAYKETRFIEWSFRNGANSYKWDKKRGSCLVKWDDYEVRLNLGDTKQSKVLKDGQKLSGEEKMKRITQAIDMFNNDSFWLVAPFKVFDKGTRRSLVTMKNGDEAFLVTYTSGGTTPGDSYLWILNESGFPKAFQMWVSIIPIGGIEASWDDWQITESGTYLPKSHELGPLTLSMGIVKGYN